LDPALNGNEEETVSDNTADDNNEPSDSTESARQTVERVFKEAQEGKVDGDGSESAEEPVSDKPAQAPQRAKDQREWDPELQPPERFKVDQKELFNRLPKGMKREVNRMVREHEQVFTRSQQQLSAARKEHDDIEAVIRPFVGNWAERGISRSHAIAELVGAHEKLSSPDKNTRLEKMAWLCQNCQIDPNELAQFAGGGAVQRGGAQTADPRVQQLEQQIVRLQSEIAPIQSGYQRSVQQQHAQVVNTITAELYAVKHETDVAGRYRYPELHDDGFLERTKPLVSSIVEGTPGISYGEALKRAHSALTGRSSGNSPLTRLPASDQNIQSRAVSAATSVRGRSAVPASGVGDDDLPLEARKSTRATVEYLYKQQQQGR